MASFQFIYNLRNYHLRMQIDEMQWTWHSMAWCYKLRHCLGVLERL